ncbi:MAG: RNA polymerase sigma factor [Bacteroidales bacterium]|nr:RNA polymerase sigma factor [Bacteroidales bacterium]
MTSKTSVIDYSKVGGIVAGVLRTRFASTKTWLRGEDKEDLTEDVKERIFRKESSFDPAKGSFNSWASKIAYNTIADYLDKKNRVIVEPLYFTDETGDLYERDDVFTTTTAEDEFIAAQCESFALNVASTRGEMDKRIFEMSLKGFKPREIAVKLGVTPSEVHTRLHRTRKAIEAGLNEGPASFFVIVIQRNHYICRTNQHNYESHQPRGN